MSAKRSDQQKIWQRNSEIRQLFKSGAKQKELAAMFGVSITTICRVISGKDTETKTLTEHPSLKRKFHKHDHLGSKFMQ
jgi:Trp operon repressor